MGRKRVHPDYAGLLEERWRERYGELTRFRARFGTAGYRNTGPGILP